MAAIPRDGHLPLLVMPMAAMSVASTPALPLELLVPWSNARMYFNLVFSVQYPRTVSAAVVIELHFHPTGNEPTRIDFKAVAALLASLDL